MCDFQTSDRRENHPSCCQPARFLSKSRLSFSHQGKHFLILKVCFYVCVGGGGGYYPDLYFQYFSLLFFSLNIKKHSHNLLYIYRRNFWFHFCWIPVIKVNGLENLHYNFYVIPKGKRHVKCLWVQIIVQVFTTTKYDYRHFDGT